MLVYKKGKIMLDTQEENNTVKQIATLAKQAEYQNVLDWSKIQMDEDQVIVMMAENVVEQLGNVPEEQREIIAMSTITKLLVENFVLGLLLKGVPNEKNSE